MKTGNLLPVFLFILFLLYSCDIRKDNVTSVVKKTADPLPSWSDNKTNEKILHFIKITTDQHSEYFIPVDDRIAVFDNDGTLWSEKPLYFQMYFILDRIKEMAPEHSEWETKQPYKAALENDLQAIMEMGVQGLLMLSMEAQAGMTADEFNRIVKEWIESARHPETGLLYKDMVYQPMIEILNYLRNNGFKTYIVSGGGLDFMRPWTEEVYGIPPEQVIGSTMKSKLEWIEGNPVITKLPEIEFVNDKEGKPISIQRIIGKKPVAAFGNSDGDLAMMQWTASGNSNKLLVYIHHTDSIREWAYDRDSHIGRLDKGLDEAAKENWVIVNMETDWISVYAGNN